MATRLIQGPLTSNGFTLEDTPDRLGWLEPSDPTTPLDLLRQQYNAQGYLWLKGILNREAILEFRRLYFSAFQDVGLIEPGTDPVDGICSKGILDQQAINKRLFEFVKRPEFEELCLSEPIVKFYETFLGGEVYLCFLQVKKTPIYKPICRMY